VFPPPLFLDLFLPPQFRAPVRLDLVLSAVIRGGLPHVAPRPMLLSLIL
jgi:hypothetical protein